MSEQRYEQGMARPEIDIGAGSGERKPVAERTTLLTGGAGFIGGHLVRALLDTGRRVVVLDVRAYTPEARFAIGEGVDEIPLEVASIGDQARVLDVFRTHRPDEVVHAGMPLGEDVALEPLEPPDCLAGQSSHLGELARDR